VAAGNAVQVCHDRRVSGAPVLELSDATVVKDQRAVLHGLRLTIHDGEHTAILGPNGAGKSMLVGLLTHHERPLVSAQGVDPVRVFGEARWHVGELRTQLGIVSPALHQQFVRGNSEGRITGQAAVVSAFVASHGIVRYGVISADMQRRATRALEAVGAGHLAGRTLDEMSGGEARRVMLARALVTEPRALVLDEPTGGLDLAARHAFMDRVRAIARAGTTLLLISHHIEEIIPEVGRVLFLKHGRIVADGRPEVLLTADRLGELFDLPLTVERVDGYVYARPRTPAASATA
jgi:iron complex transport system ATP-binding protein